MTRWKWVRKQIRRNLAIYKVVQHLNFICWCRVRIKIIYPNWWFYHLIKSLFVDWMCIIISLGLLPRNSTHPTSKQWFYWAIKSQFGIYYLNYLHINTFYLRNNISQTVILLLNNITVWSSDAGNYITRA